MLAEIESVCDRVAILRKGTLIKSGTVQEITTNMERYVFELEYPVNSYLTILEQSAQPYFQENDYRIAIQVKDLNELNKFIDFLRANEVQIASLSRQKNSLEDSFIKAIKEGSQI
jgi:ABC-2 type transport system ATP-binding protein